MSFCPDCRAEYVPGIKQCYDCKVGLVDTLVDEAAQIAPAQERLVTIAIFETSLKASILASRLEAEGIECFIEDEEAIAANGLLANALGGVKIQVRGVDSQRATAIALLQAPARTSHRSQCHRCGSREVHRKGMSALVAILAVLTLGIWALFFTPKWKCSKCGNQWR